MGRSLPLPPRRCSTGSTSCIDRLEIRAVSSRSKWRHSPLRGTACASFSSMGTPVRGISSSRRRANPPLDWEAADAEGMPLWDLFHFLRSFGFSLSKEAGRHDHLRSFADHVLAASELNRLLVETTTRYCAQTSLSPGSCSRSSTSAGCIAPSRRHLACGKTGCSRAATSTFCVSPSTDGTPLGCNVSFTAGSPLSHRCGSSSVPLRRRSLP